jgi:hypothetical protein
MGDVVRLKTVSYLPIPVTAVIDETPRDLDQLIVVGVTKEGEFYFASSEPDGGTILWWLEMAKRKLIDTALDMEGK